MKDLFGNEDPEPETTHGKKAKSNPCIAKYGPYSVPGVKCNTCAHLYVKEFAKRYYKCSLREDTNSESTDHGKFWPACSKHKTKI